MAHEPKRGVPNVGDEIWMPGGKRKVLEVRCTTIEVRECDVSSNREISQCKTVKHSLLIADTGGRGPSWFDWEDNLDKQQGYFEEHFKRRNCRTCQYPLPWAKCEIHDRTTEGGG